MGSGHVQKAPCVRKPQSPQPTPTLLTHLPRARGKGASYRPRTAPSWRPRWSSSAGRKPRAVHTGCHRSRHRCHTPGRRAASRSAGTRTARPRTCFQRSTPCCRRTLAGRGTEKDQESGVESLMLPSWPVRGQSMAVPPEEGVYPGAARGRGCFLSTTRATSAAHIQPLWTSH